MAGVVGRLATGIRSADVADADELIALWREAGLRFDPSRVVGELRPAAARNPGLVPPTPTTGRRSQERCAAPVPRSGEPPGRQAGHARIRRRDQLMAELGERLKAIGCPETNLLIEADNAGVLPFCQALGDPGR